MGLPGDSSPDGDVHLERDSNDNSISPVTLAFAKLLQQFKTSHLDPKVRTNKLRLRSCPGK
jgi:hypothetical protein